MDCKKMREEEEKQGFVKIRHDNCSKKLNVRFENGL
jgi:hypothetical protein